MTLPQYYRTAKGNQALESRSVKLSSRQRALLLMIENGHASHLSQQQLRQLATPDNLAVLLEHQLITVAEATLQPTPQKLSQNIQPVEAVNPVAATRTHVHADLDSVLAQPAVTIISETRQQTNAAVIVPEDIPNLAGQDIVISADLHSAVMLHSTPVYLSFDEVKQLMMNSLREYCGLLASALIKDIQHASSMTKLRMCQMRWVTTLTETRASSAQIAVWVEQINYSLSCPHESPASVSEALTL